MIDHNKVPFVRELMKDNSEEEIQEAEDRLRRLVGVIARIAERKVREENGETEDIDPLLQNYS